MLRKPHPGAHTQVIVEQAGFGDEAVKRGRAQAGSGFFDRSEEIFGESIPMKEVTSNTFETCVLKSLLPVVVVIWGVG